MDACNKNPDQVQANEQCYQNKLLQDNNLQNVATSEANRLISLFAIK
jgi:hypothetical protein